MKLLYKSELAWLRACVTLGTFGVTIVLKTQEAWVDIRSEQLHWWACSVLFYRSCCATAQGWLCVAREARRVRRHCSARRIVHGTSQLLFRRVLGHVAYDVLKAILWGLKPRQGHQLRATDAQRQCRAEQGEYACRCSQTCAVQKGKEVVYGTRRGPRAQNMNVKTNGGTGICLRWTAMLRNLDRGLARERRTPPKRGRYLLSGQRWRALARNSEMRSGGLPQATSSVWSSTRKEAVRIKGLLPICGLRCDGAP